MPAIPDKNIKLNGPAIRKLRLTRELNLREIAIKTNKTEKTIGEIERDANYSTSQATVYSLAKAYEMTFDDFIKQFSRSPSQSYLDRIATLIDPVTAQHIDQAETDAEVAEIMLARCSELVRGKMKVAARGKAGKK